MIAFPVGSSGETITLGDAVLDHLRGHRQLRFWQREAGGLLFARLDAATVEVVRATGPRPSDRRHRYSYAGDRTAEQREIDELHSEGMHYVGEWHTHPEPRPVPSSRDLSTMASRVRESRHGLAGFLFLIVGQAPAPDGVTALLHDGVAAYRLVAGSAR